MRKILSLILTICLLLSCSVTVLADKQTTIRYVAEGTSSYEVTVPELMTPGSTETVTLEGTWTSEEKVVVSAPTSVTLTNDIDGDTEDLSVTFNGFEVVGDNRESISLSEDITVASMPDDVIFGTWEGIITYSVTVESTVESTVELITFTIAGPEPQAVGTEYQAESGMTWGEWVESEYNTDGYKYFETVNSVQSDFSKWSTGQGYIADSTSEKGWGNLVGYYYEYNGSTFKTNVVAEETITNSEYVLGFYAD